MRIRVAKFLLLLFLVQSTQFGEVLKTPLLITHFIQHKNLYPETTVLGFLKMHYFDKTVIDADYAQDMQLPFKTVDTHFLLLQLSLPPLTVQLVTVFCYVSANKLSNKSLAKPSSFQVEIFQPPKSVA